jgi:hypothetical protein
METLFTLGGTMEMNHRSFVPRKALIGLLLLTSIVSPLLIAQQSISNTVLSDKKMCRTNPDNPIPDQWRHIAFEAAENIRNFFATLGYINYSFEKPETINLNNAQFPNSIDGWGQMRYRVEGISAIVIDKNLYDNYITSHPKTGLSTLKILIHHELFHLFIREAYKANGQFQDPDDIIKELTHSLLPLYATGANEKSTIDINKEERLADVMGSKASKCPKCVQSLVAWCCELDKETSSGQLNANQLNAMSDNQITSMIHNHLSDHATTPTTHPSYFERAGYCSIIAKELQKQGHNPCNLHA